ncbi:hypothetical protein AAVH_20921 [Aphelenchoides avenae]|nr:hypothetical protein AAVH_20921 [Aphelenchus avenae]
MADASVLLPLPLKITCYITFSIELVGHITLFTSSLMVLLLVLKVSVLHANLKTLLCCECLSSTTVSVSRFWALVRLLQQDAFEPNPPMLSRFLTGAMISVHNLLSLAYIVERLIATIWVKSYEKQRPFFGVLATFVMILLHAFQVAQSVYITGAQTYWKPTSTGSTSYAWSTLATTYASNSFGFICLGIIAWLHRYNFARYASASRFGRNVKLTERYQSSENVRATKQLFPVIFLHMLANFATCAHITTTLFWSYTDVTRFIPRVMLHFSNCITYVLCQAAVLRYHPTLRRSFLTLVSNLRNKVRGLHIHNAVRPTTSPVDLRGKALWNDPADETETYFKNLGSEWDQVFERRKPP